MKKEKSILEEDIDPEVLEQMPDWFRKLRECYERLNRDKR